MGLPSAAKQLSVEHIVVSKGDRQILADVNVSVNSGELLGILGPNGAGKSTLLHLLAGVEAPDRGGTFIDSEELGSFSLVQRARTIALQPQSIQIAWAQRVEQIVELGRYPYRGVGSSRTSSAEDRQAIDRALEATGLLDDRARSVEELSGGELMRVHLARLLATSAQFLLADEPVTSLDPYYQMHIMDIFVDQARGGRGVALVLHDLALASRYCDRVVVLQDGRVASEGSPAQALSDETMRDVFKTEVMRSHHHGRDVLLPWARLE